MIVRHKFLNNNWDNGFQTTNAVLNSLKYSPRVLFVGTFNPEVIDNTTDFFYGRNYFWRVFENLNNNNSILNGKREHNGNNPSLERIFQLCEHFKITFADIITQVDAYKENLIEDTNLNSLCIENKVKKNVDNIVNYINSTPSIKHVYFTTKNENLTNIWSMWIMIRNRVNTDCAFGSILTPSGQGGIGNFNGLNRSATIARYWLWANHLPNIHPQPFQYQDGYTSLDHSWLIDCGVDPNNF